MIRRLSMLILNIVLTSSVFAGKPNVLFIAVDDLRPYLGTYGASLVKSPNIDKLAKQGVQFERAYCQYPLCNPSRSSLLTGRRPETLQIYNLKKNIRQSDPDVVTLPQLFKNNGYESISIGKIFHAGNGNHEDMKSWTEVLKPDDYGTTARKVIAVPVKPVKKAKPKKTKPGATVDPHADDLPFNAPAVKDDQLPDGKIARLAVQALRQNKGKPFFLGVGFLKPHMPFVAPKKYWDLYNPDDVRLAPNQKPPKDSPAFANNQASELRRYKGVNKHGPIVEDLQRQLLQGYLACVSYTDAQIGLVLDELDKLGLRDNTIIVLWGDHGYQLGEHGTWNKRTNWEITARVPLVVADPASSATAGRSTNALVELVDLYPTLAEYAGLDAPENLEGTSLLPLLQKPDLPWKKAAFTTYVNTGAGMGEVIGRAMRTDRYRFVEWTESSNNAKTCELYDHNNDPDENSNIADQPENRELVEKLKSQLAGGWQAAQPRH